MKISVESVLAVSIRKSVTKLIKKFDFQKIKPNKKRCLITFS